MSKPGPNPGKPGGKPAIASAVIVRGGRLPLTRRGQRDHPATKRHMTYVACDSLAGEAKAIDGEELDAVEWVPIGDLAEYVPDGFFEPVQRYLGERLTT